VQSSGTILLADDNAEDVLLITLALKRSRIDNPLVAVSDGDEAISYLKGEGRYARRARFPIPSLIFLDLFMRRVDGFGVLTWLRQQPTLKHLPVIVITSSCFDSNVKRAYQLGADSFLVKPTEFEELVRDLKQAADFWLGTGRAPALPVAA